MFFLFIKLLFLGRHCFDKVIVVLYSNWLDLGLLPGQGKGKWLSLSIGVHGINPENLVVRVEVVLLLGKNEDLPEQVFLLGSELD